MRLLQQATLLALSAAAISASAIGKRDLATIQGVVEQVSSKTTALDNVVKGFSGQTQPLMDASNDLISTIKQGVTTVSATTPLTQNDALTLAGIVQGLNTSVATAVDDLIAKKSALVSASAGGLVLQALQDQKSGATDLANAITSKVPTALQTLAAQLSSGIANSLQRGIDAFQGTGSAPPGSTSGGGAPPTPTTTTPVAPPPGGAPTTTPATAPVGSLPPTGGGSSPTGSMLPPTQPSGISPPSSGGSGGGSYTPSSGSSAPPAQFTGAASSNQVGTSALAFVVGCAALFM